MEITLRELVESEQALANLAQSRQPVKTAYRISRLLRLAEPELKAFYEARRTLLERFGTAQENGQYRIEPGKIAAFEKELSALLDEKITFEVAPVSIEDLQGEISASDLVAMEWFLDGTGE